MAKKVILKDENLIEVMPITRAELVLDSAGNQALHSHEFLATDTQPGLMSPNDKQKLETVAGNTVDTELSNTSTNPVQNKVLTQIINSIRDEYLKSAVISENKITITDQSDNTIEFGNSTYQIVTNTIDGLVPKYDAVDGTIDNQSTDWVLTNHNGTLGWYELPANAFKNDNTNTTYSLSGALSGNTYTTILTDSDSDKTIATVPAMSGASSTTAGSAGLVPAPTNINTFLKGDGTWSVVDNSLTANKLSETQVFDFANVNSNYCKVVSIKITSRYKGSSGLLRFYTNRSNKGTNTADSFDVYLHAYQQNVLGNKPVLTFKSSNTGDGYDVVGILNTSSTSTTFDLYVYGKGYTHHDLYVSLIQGNLTIHPEICDSLAEGTQIKPTPMGNSQLLNGYKQGFTNGTIPIYIPFPGYSLLIQKKLLSEDYTTQNYPDEEFLKAICKWAIDEYKDKGAITLIGNVTPNSSGTCILHLYSSSGKKSDPDSPYDGLPRYCRGQYLDLGGNLQHFGTNEYVWSYGRFAQSTELTTSSRSKNVTDKGWYRIATSKSSILRCLGTFEIEGSVSGKHTVTTVQSGINYSTNPFITILNTSHFGGGAITKVRIVYHTTYTNNYAYLEIYKDTTTSTSLTIKLANGYGWSLCDITTGSVPTGYSYKEISLNSTTLSTTGNITTSGSFYGNLNNTLTFTAGAFSAKTYNNSAATTVNIPTHTSHLTNNSGFLTSLPSHSHSYLPLSGGQMNSDAYISWNNEADGNDLSDWKITGNGLRIISSSTTTSNAPTQYSTALHVKGRYGFQLASQGGAGSNNFYIRNISNNNWNALIHSGNISSQSVNYASSAGKADTSNSTSKLKVHDVRDDARDPNYFDGSRVTAWFNNKGTPSTNWYSGIHVKGWTNSYTSWELCSYSSTGTDNNYNLYFRSGNNTTWGNWKTIITSGNIGSQSVNYATTAGTANTAVKLQTQRKLWGQDFDGSADVSGNMTNVGTINNYFNFQSGNSVTAVLHAENVSATVDYTHIYVSNLDKSRKDRPLVLQNDYGNVGIGATAPTQKLEVNGNVKATSFIGDLDGTYVNALTGYTKSTSASDLATTDTLNTALGKLEYKAHYAYNWVTTVTATDTDEYINKWDEIVGFLDSVKEGTDILDEFVTRKTDQTITGIKTFSKVINITNSAGSWVSGMTNAAIKYDSLNALNSGSYHPIIGIKTYKENVVNFGAYVHDVGFYGYKKGRTENSYDWLFIFNSETGAITHTGKSITAVKFIGNLNNTLTFSAGGFSAKTYNNSAAVTVSIPTHTSHLTNNSGFLTQHQSLDNYVTLNGTQTITGVKTFSTQQKFTVAQGTSPFTVTSTTKVSNLNSDLLDGYDSSRFLRAKDWVTNPGQDADTLEYNMMCFTYSNNAPHTGTIIYFAGATGGNYGLQLNASYLSSGYLSFRSRNGDSGTWQDWSTILTQHNYTGYVNTTNFPGLNKTGTVTSVTVTGANGLSGSGTVTSSGTITLSNSGVRSTTINGNYLRVNTNGTNADLTIPYATTAGSANSVAWGNITGKPSSYTPSAHNHSYIKGGDNRNVDNDPSWYMTNLGSASVYTEFSQSGGAVSGTYENRTTFTPWTNNSGQRPVQLAFNNSGVFMRTSKSDTEWNSWYTVYHSGNLTKSTIGLGNVQNTAFYQRVTTVNGTAWNMAGTNSNATFTIYAPTTAGTSGQVLTSTGGTPGWSNQSDLSVGFATHIKQKSSLNNLTTYKTVKAIKDQLVTEFANISEGIGANVTVPEQAISNWDNEDVTLSASSVYSMIKIGGGYNGTIYGQWLLSSYNLSRIGYVGRTSSTWSSIRWIATTDDLTNYMKATKENGYYGLTTPEGSSSAYIRTTSNGLLPYQSGGITNGHCYIGTSAWYFNQAYITKVNCNTVESSVDLFINGTSSIQLKTNTNQSAVVLNTTQFKPFDTANNKLTLGSDTARWANTYSVKGNFSGQITSSVATGTSPFSITSTTKNTNLNADMIDGYHIVVTDTVPAVPANKTIYFIY